MKVRRDFISNSSSSSFIIACYENSFVDRHGLSKEDFREAFIDLLGGKEPYASVFSIYDKDIKEDLEYINSDATDYLKDWKSMRMMYDNNKKEYVLSRGDNVVNFDEIYEKLRDIYGLPYSYDIINDNSNKCSKYVKSLKKYVYRPIPLHVKKLVRELYEYYGILTNKDVLNAEFSRFLVHFGENDVWSLRGSDEPGKNEDKWDNPHSEYEKEFNDKVDKSLWESDSQTIERVVEILFNWFRDHGKLKDLKPDETWKSLMNDIVAATMHEG